MTFATDWRTQNPLRGPYDNDKPIKQKMRKVRALTDEFIVLTGVRAVVGEVYEVPAGDAAGMISMGRAVYVE
jgi:hypothetical protein